MPLAANIIIYASVLIVGAVIGSFLNVLIYRVPRKQDFVSDRSHCPHCGQALKALDLLPVISYLVLGGKCRHCKQRISVRYLAI